MSLRIYSRDTPLGCVNLKTHTYVTPALYNPRAKERGSHRGTTQFTMDLGFYPMSLRVFDVTFFLVGLYLINKLLRRTTRDSYKFPPGPKPLPLIGNLFDLPKDRDWVHWVKHKDIYGSINSLL